jgi:glycosyltransferase involved in cell wall biosynthesis
MKIAALILTFNEEINISECLNSLNFVDEMYVIDSFSSDNTVSIAEKEGAIVYERDFDTYSAQRNFGFDKIPSHIDWILMFDADERIPTDLKNEILEKIKNVDQSISSFNLRRKDIIFGKWLKRSTGYPTWAPRVFKNGSVKVEREINEQYLVNGKTLNLKGHFLHYPFSKGIHWWLNKHNVYSAMEAEKLIIEVKTKFNFFKLFSKNKMEIRKAQKNLFYRLPYRPQIMFFSLYILRLGFLDGKAGYTYCKLRKTYEWMIELKMNEIRSKTN